ncbi:MAG: hypothetical protein QXH30_02880 [Candidatus Bilamarchaeaceae archaeon]
MGCAAPDETYKSSILEGQKAAEESGSILGAIVNQWRLFTVVFLLLSIGLIALAYPIANAFNMPEVRAWADVELGEAFGTALIVVASLAILVFAELVTHSYLAADPDFSGICSDSNEYCPAQVARHYIEEYFSKSSGIYEDIQINALKSGKLAMMTMGAGIQYFMLGFPSASFRPYGGELIVVNTYMQEMQLLSSLRDALIFQEFIINNISLLLAPTALMLGIILRTFFITRKLGGQLMAFGIGFILVYPATYAIAMYTVKATIYGSEGSGGQAGGEFCTYQCMALPPLAYNVSTGEGFTWSDLTGIFPQEEGESNSAYKARIRAFVESEICIDIPQGDGGVVENCVDYPDTLVSPGGDTIASCGKYNPICPIECRTLPYPNYIPECSSWMVEFQCRENVPAECFMIKTIDVENDPKLSSLEPRDYENCPMECRVLVGLKKEGCQVGYGFALTEEIEEDPEKVDEQMASDGYLEGEYNPLTIKEKIEKMCEDSSASSFLQCGELAESTYEDYNTSEILERFFGYEDVQINKTIEWDRGCPNQCRFITTGGKKGFGCSMCDEKNFPDNPQVLWEKAKEAAAEGDFEGQLEAAEESCVMIIPDVVYEVPSRCSECNYVIDRGFAAYPPVHLDCGRLCGTEGGVSTQSDKASFTSQIGGFTGSAEMKSIAELVVPALVLPLLNIAITFMFINTLSPMLGGAVDFQGMMRFFK